MNSINKKPPRGIPQPFNPQAGRAPQIKSVVAQLKPGVSVQSFKRSVAPPVYRPQPLPKVLQTKSSSGQRPLGQALRSPIAPPVYRPEAKKIVQPKTISQQRKLPTPAPVYRPEQKRIVQGRIASAAKPHTPPRVLPHAASSKLPIQAKQAQSMQSPASSLRKPPTTISRRGHASGPIIQRKVGFEFELGYIKTQKDTALSPFSSTWNGHSRGEVILHRQGYDVTADVSDDGGSQIEFVLHEIDEHSSGAKNAIVNAAKNVVTDIQKLCQFTGKWVAGKQIWDNSPRGHRFLAEFPFSKQVGQLQMTGGIDIERIGHIVSGQAGDVTDRHHMKAAEFLGNYKSRNTQPVWTNALPAVKRNFPDLPLHQREVLAGVVTMIAQVPLSMHGEAASMGGQGMFTAKTDYSRILVETVRYIGQNLPEQAFVQTVMETINGTIAAGLNPGKRLLVTDGVFPDDYGVKGVRLGGVLTIGRWLRDMLPHNVQGIDRLTPHGFPGSDSQRKEMRAFGRFGSKTDPINRPIVEWRNISACYPDHLPELVADLVDYLHMANKKPEIWEVNPEWARVWHSRNDMSKLTEFPRLPGE